VSIPLTLGGIFRYAADVYRRLFGRVALTAVAVFVPVGLAETIVHSIAEHANAHPHPGLSLLALILVPVVGFLSMFGEVFYAGVLEDVVGADLAGQPLPSVREIARSLPLGMLIVADLLVSLITQIGDDLVVPGMVLFTLFAIVGPVVNIERLGPIAALKRSVELVWPHFWLAAGAALVPALILEAMGVWFVTSARHSPLPLVLAISLLLSFSLAAFLGLTQVVLAHALIAADQAKA
jgi:hypothetical protein